MTETTGFVGTIESETRGVSRLWFGLTENQGKSDWVQISNKRAWFTMNMETADRPSEMAKLTLLLEAMRSDLHVEVTHEGAASFHKRVKGDSFECNGIRILRDPMRF